MPILHEAGYLLATCPAVAASQVAACSCPACGQLQHGFLQQNGLKVQVHGWLHPIQLFSSPGVPFRRHATVLRLVSEHTVSLRAGPGRTAMPSSSVPPQGEGALQQSSQQPIQQDPYRPSITSGAQQLSCCNVSTSCLLSFVGLI